MQFIIAQLNTALVPPMTLTDSVPGMMNIDGLIKMMPADVLSINTFAANADKMAVI